MKKQPDKRTVYYRYAANRKTILHFDNQIRRMCRTAMKGGDGR